MKPFSIRLFAVILCVYSININASSVDDWGATGHRVVGEIAQKYLKGKAKREVKRLLKQHSLAFASTYGDEIKSDKAYDKYYTWHFVNMPFSETYETSVKNPEGDIVTGIEACKAVLLDKNASDEDKVFHLKMLIHLMGDLHQPMHVGLAEDKGGNDFKLQWFYKDTNLHRVWDSDMIEEYNMGYDELADNADAISKNEIKTIQKGSITDWVNETHELTKKVYASVEPNENLRYRYSYNHFNTVRNQLQIAGIRLAKVLNDIF